MHQINKTQWIALFFVLGFVIVFAGHMLLANNGNQTASSKADDQNNVLDGCAMMESDVDMSDCSMCNSSINEKSSSMVSEHHGFTSLTGTVMSVGENGLLNIKIQSTNDEEKNILAGIKTGDSLSIIILDHAGKNIGTDSKVVRYVCPMHPEIVSTKPGKCQKCGMNLEPEKSNNK